jgi:integrase
LPFIDHTIDVLSAVRRTAKKCGDIQDNPTRSVDMPASKTTQPKWALTVEQAARLLEQLAPLPRTMVGLAIVTGLRRGELFALRWKDIDEQRQLLTVREAIYDGKFSTPKTAAGLRQVPLSELALDLIRQWNPRAASTESEALVFATSAGTPILPANVLYRSITPACKAAGLPKATWLTVRRTTRHGHTRRMYRARWWRS